MTALCGLWPRGSRLTSLIDDIKNRKSQLRRKNRRDQAGIAAQISPGFPLYRFFGGEPLYFRPLDQPHQLGAALKGGSERRAVVPRALGLGQDAIERVAFLGQPRDFFFGPARGLAQRLEFAPALRGEPPGYPAAAGLRLARTDPAPRSAAVEHQTLVILEISREGPSRPGGDQPEPVGDQFEQMPIVAHQHHS